MTTDIKTFLKSAYWKKIELDTEFQRIAELRSLAEKATASYSLAPGGGSDTTSKQEAFAIKVSEAIERMNRLANEYIDITNAVHDLIEQVPDDQLRTVLKLRYLSYKKWEEIAVELHYHWKYIHRLHAEALKEVTKCYLQK